MTMASTAPSWITTWKVLFGLSKPRKWLARTRWPVEETGMNSVAPSRRPRRRAVAASGRVMMRPGGCGAAGVPRPKGSAPQVAGGFLERGVLPRGAEAPEVIGEDRLHGGGGDAQRVEAT